MKPKQANLSRTFSNAEYTLKQRGPDRVLVNEDGEAVSSFRAANLYGVTPDVVFLRKDGWMLGAPSQWEPFAFRMWEGEWVGFSRGQVGKFSPISEYVG